MSQQKKSQLKIRAKFQRERVASDKTPEEEEPAQPAEEINFGEEEKLLADAETKKTA